MNFFKLSFSDCVNGFGRAFFTNAKHSIAPAQIAVMISSSVEFLSIQVSIVWIILVGARSPWLL